MQLIALIGKSHMLKYCTQEYNVFPYDPAIPLLDIYPKELKAGSQREICKPLFIAALFTVASSWKQQMND